MRRRTIVVVVALLAAVSVTFVAAEFDQAAYEKATHTILCDCGCHPQNIDQCACGRAAEMRQEVAALVESGMTGDEIVNSYVAQYGEQIRIAPTASGFNLVAWLGPFALLVVASFGLWWVLRRWTHRAAREDATPATVPSLPADDPYLERLRRQVEEDR